MRIMLTLLLLIVALHLSHAQSRRMRDLPKRFQNRKPDAPIPWNKLTKEEIDTYYAQRKARKIAEKAKVALYPNNFVRLFPIHFLDGGGFGVGASYEKLLGKKKYFGVLLQYSYISDVIFATDVNLYPYQYLSTGFKFYPFGQNRVTYAFGPLLVLGYSKAVEGGWHNTSPRRGETVQDYKGALLLNNYLNIQFNKNISFSLELGMGQRFLDRRVYLDNSMYDAPVEVTGSFAVGMGFRF